MKGRQDLEIELKWNQRRNWKRRQVKNKRERLAVIKSCLTKNKSNNAEKWVGLQENIGR